ncbi:MAG: hypothetical protein KAI66_21570 [Lentisphaeria bacterium]|nr:hypothetical protein [Lentisphaeria bacterium]
MKKWCKNWVMFIQRQMQWLREAIDENKWYMSERAGHDVGWEAAERDFNIHHLNRVGNEFRIAYCTVECPKIPICLFQDDIPGLSRRWGA